MLLRVIPPSLLVFLILIYKVSCQGASLTFVIDNTGSMGDDINQVRNEVDSIMDIVLDKKSSQISNIVLVTFNDPEKPVLWITTTNRDRLKWALATVKVGGGGDCDELALSGIQLAIESSLPGSYIYVFTDASAKDYRMSEEIQQLCQRKQSQIVFVLTGDCGYPSRPQFQVYYNISTASSGLTIRVPKWEVGTVVNKFLEEDIKGNKTVLTTQLTPPNIETKVPFMIDDLTKYAIVSASGTNVQLLEINGPSLKMENVISTAHGKVVKLLGTTPGEYTVTVKSTSGTSVVITGRSDFYFHHGFSEQQPKSLHDTAPQPFSDTLTHLSFLVTDPNDLVRIKTAQILDMKENMVKEMPLKELWPNFYTTEPFVAPSYMFKVALTGEVIETGSPIRRIAKIPVTPQKPPPGTPIPKAPVVEIKEGASIEVARGGGLTLTCKVSAYPEPEITWRNNRGIRIKSKTSRVQIPYDYISYLNISSATEATYYCHARNSLDDKQFKAINVIIKDPFIINAVPEGTTNIAYGTESTLNCDVRSQQPLQIRWYRVSKHSSETEHVIPSQKYSISSDGTRLKIVSMDVDLVGKYTCKVFLQRDPTQKREFSTNVEISGLVPPKIDPDTKKIEVKEHMAVSIKCKLLEGVPKPTVSWQKKDVGSAEYRSIPGSSSELRIEQAALAHGGHYKCVADNVAGRREQVVAELVVLKAPAVVIVEGATMNVRYGSRLTLTCRVTANPEPTFVWKDSAGKTLLAMGSVAKNSYEHTRTIVLSDLKASSKYSCSAINNQGSSTKSIQVSVSSPFNVQSHPPASISGKFGTKVNLKCQITSHLPMEIRWYHTKDSTSEKNEIKTSNQYMILSNGAELQINKMDVDLVGEYTCKASLLDYDEHIERTTQVQIEGLEIPAIRRVGDQTVLAGTSVSIRCDVIKGVPYPKLTWQFKTAKSGKFVDIYNTGSTWHTSNVTTENSGYYKCIATNSQGTDEHIVQLVVEVPARIITEQFIYEGITSDIALRVPCDTIGFPKPIVRWDIYGSLVIPGEKYAVEDGTLIIKSPIRSGNYSYTCTATNTVGSDAKRFDVYVTDYLNDFGVCHDIFLLKDESTILHCTLPRIVSSSVKWFMNGVDVNITTPYLNIDSPTESNDGNYTCHVSDIHGSASETYVVDVGYPPKFKFPQDHNVKWSGDEDDLLRCDVTVKPTPKVEWTFNGKPLVGVSALQMYITKVGHYQCNVRNVHGAVQRDFYVNHTNI